jgi:hypothetical protein
VIKYRDTDIMSMNGYPSPPGVFDADETMRAKLQEELRRHQALQATGAVYGPPHHNMEAGPYFRSGYPQPPHPPVRYGEPHQSYPVDPNATTSNPLVAHMYAASQQHHQKQQVMQHTIGGYPSMYGAYPSTAATSGPYPQPAPPPYAYPPPVTATVPIPTFTPQPTPEPYSGTDQTKLDQIARMQQQYKIEREKSNRRHQTSYTSQGKPTALAASVTKSPAKKAKVRSPRPSSNATKLPLFLPRKKETAVLGKDNDGKAIVQDRGSTWYLGSVPLGVDDDKYWLSELQVYLRANFAEIFAATEDDISAPMHGRNKPIALGQVGIRCMHCKLDNPAERGQQATSYPSQISGLYNSVQQMLRLHLDCCLNMPSEIRTKIDALKGSCSSRGGRKQYWVDSAKRLGLVDTPQGIHFERDPLGPLPPLTGPSVNTKIKKEKTVKPKKEKTVRTSKKATTSSKKKGDQAASEEVASSAESELVPKNDHSYAEAQNTTEKDDLDEQPLQPANDEEPFIERPSKAPLDTRPLVFPEDRDLISDYLYLALEQTAPCLLMESDRVGCYKTRKVGFPGLACKHCVGQAGCGRYFPATEASLSQTTTSQTIMNHVRNCRRCPPEIRENLEIMKRSHMGPDGKRSEKPKHGGRKVFFHRLWCRVQGIPFTEGRSEARERRSKKKRKRKKGANSDESGDGEDDEGGDMMSSDEDSDSEEYSNTEIEKSKSKRNATKVAFRGCVRLTKADDPHWLSEMECFARSDLVEIFSYSHKDELEGYGGRKEPSANQVGIRCVYCKNLEPATRPNGCVNFPESLSLISTKMADIIRLHFPSCPAVADDARRTFKSLRGFDAKVATDDSHQYWVDAARDVGLANVPQDRGHSWGLIFCRDPLQPSPADELDLEASGEQIVSYGKNSLIRAEDKGLCTDQVLLLLRQVRPCRFKKGDHRAGSGSRGRDRSIGFPGLCCVHCSGRKSLGTL